MLWKSDFDHETAYRVRICKPFKEPMNRFPLAGRYDIPIWFTCPLGFFDWRNRFLRIDSCLCSKISYQKPLRTFTITWFSVHLMIFFHIKMSFTLMIDCRDSWSLVIKSVQESDAGKYICQVRQIFANLTTVVYTDKWFENRKISGDLSIRIL